MNYPRLMAYLKKHGPDCVHSEGVTLVCSVGDNDISVFVYDDEASFTYADKFSIRIAYLPSDVMAEIENWKLSINWEAVRKYREALYG